MLGCRHYSSLKWTVSMPVRPDLRNAASTLPAFIWDEALIRRYDLSGPRYTSYPTAVEFTADYGVEQMMEAAARSQANARPLSLYTHLPFCAHLCYYCACNKIGRAAW